MIIEISLHSESHIESVVTGSEIYLFHLIDTDETLTVRNTVGKTHDLSIFSLAMHKL